MDKTNIIAGVFGAGITLVATIIVTIIQFYFQTRHAESSRKWQIEDKKREELIAIRKKKVNNAEASLKKLHKIAINIAEWEMDFSTYAHVAKITGSYLGIMYLHKNGANSDLTKYIGSKNFNKKC